MLNIVRDYLDGVESVRTSYLKLREQNPNHEYLQHATFDEDGRVTIAPEFLKMFEPKNWPVKDELQRRLHTFSNAREALEEAIGKVA